MWDDTDEDEDEDDKGDTDEGDTDDTDDNKDDDDEDDEDDENAQTGTKSGSLISVGCILGITCSDLSGDECDLPLARLSVFRGLLEGFNIPETFTRLSPGSGLLRVEGWATAPVMSMTVAMAAPALNAAAAITAFLSASALCSAASLSAAITAATAGVYVCFQV